ncbi:MAG: Ubiquinol-cytochrome C reductase, cytochrome B subunit [uncultured Thermomicrobiales bacterium]|uniref:Ubiquinol-cytochrome C reductase, cytochrome B subunit n=1 Tax=uncultured Thermomicrobiales bacterium TaxID=1645740 RepID=A0A6J4VTT7_9BACT|nr:MAG: Ubiquinol-cytochrome C reductase, cytochrome B subunit [uncultured Thermomicrobiales bacterium]
MARQGRSQGRRAAPNRQPGTVQQGQTTPARQPDKVRQVQEETARSATSTLEKHEYSGFMGWLDERVGIEGFYRKFGHKAFPVHTSFFLGEMCVFSFVILVATGAYLGLIYVPSNVEVDYNGQKLPEAYASVKLIESIPVANIFRNVHHWGAHVMIASVILHSMRVFFTGAYRKPRELNWVIGVVLLILTIGAGFIGYSLPYDSYAVTATGIGYSIARSIPLVGNIAAELVFGGAFPTLGSLPRLYTLHIFIVPALLTAVMGLHLVLIIKQKHTQPGYARKIAEPGKVLGVSLWPYQAILAGQLLFFMFGGLFLLSAFVPVHPLDAFGPPGPQTPEVKPDWYLMWTYGFLKLVPPQATLTLPGGITIGPEFLGGLVFPGLLFSVLTAAPWLDRTNRSGKRYEYLEPARQSPLRLALGIGFMAYIGALFIAAYYDSIGLTILQTWLVTIAIPLVTAAGVFLWQKQAAAYREENFDPTAEDMPPKIENLPAD